MESKQHMEGESPVASLKECDSPAASSGKRSAAASCSDKARGPMERSELGRVKTQRRGHACKVSPCAGWGVDADPSATARDQFARTFADVLGGRFGGSWSVEWQRANRSASSTNRDRRTFTGKKEPRALGDGVLAIVPVLSRPPHED
jgi:hypothetical protein